MPVNAGESEQPESWVTWADVLLERNPADPEPVDGGLTPLPAPAWPGRDRDHGCRARPLADRPRLEGGARRLEPAGDPRHLRVPGARSAGVVLVRLV